MRSVQVARLGRVGKCALSARWTGSCHWTKRTGAVKASVLAVYFPHSAATKELYSLYVAFSQGHIKRGGEKMKKTRMLVTVALLIALEIILTRFLSIKTPIVRISFGFIPIAFSAILFGPVAGGITGALADLLGFFIFPQGTFFPGFTLSAFISGTCYGFFLHKKPDSFVRVLLSVLVIALVVDLGLNTLWLSFITNTAWGPLLITRIIKVVLMYPVQVLLIHFLWRSVGGVMPAGFFRKSVNV
jgi:ECF transporter S component (folate family)